MASIDTVAMFSAFISFASMFLVIFQLRNHTEQEKLSSLMHLCEINRDLISLGFDHPILFDILLDMENTDPIWEQRYLQLWLNQLALIHAYMHRGAEGRLPFRAVQDQSGANLQN